MTPEEREEYKKKKKEEALKRAKELARKNWTEKNMVDELMSFETCYFILM